MKRFVTGMVITLLAGTTLCLAQEVKPRAYTLVVSGAR